MHKLDPPKSYIDVPIDLSMTNLAPAINWARSTEPDPHKGIVDRLASAQLDPALIPEAYTSLDLPQTSCLDHYYIHMIYMHLYTYNIRAPRPSGEAGEKAGEGGLVGGALQYIGLIKKGQRELARHEPFGHALC